MAEKLLSKSTKSLLAFSVLLLLVAAPVLLFLTNFLYLQETDETMALHKEDFQKQHTDFTPPDILLWNRYNRNVKILPADGVLRDTVFTKTYFDKAENEDEPYREFHGNITIGGNTYLYQERTNLIERQDLVWGVALLFCFVILLMLAGILILNKMMSRRLWKPFYTTLAEVEQFEVDKSRRPELGATGIAEFDRLNKSVDQLIEKNLSIYRTQKEFVENAAHELQTPIALFQGKVDALLQTPLSEEQSRLLAALSTDVTRLNRLNRNLLLLSKIEKGGFAEEKTALHDLMLRNLPFFEEQAAARGIGLSAKSDSVIEVDANPALAEILFNNLLMNAIRHNIDNGTIDIRMGSDWMSFTNTGSAIALDRENMFKRFSKSDASGQGNGLGLAIVGRIAEVHGWRISYGFANERHTFTVYFP